MKSPYKRSTDAASVATAPHLGLEAGEHVRCCLEELRNPAFEVKTWETAAQNTRLIIATDAPSLYDHVNKDAGMPKDRPR